MTITAEFLVNGSLLSADSNRLFLVAGGSTVTLSLTDTTGATNVEWSFFGASETVTYPTITQTGRGTASFTAPAAPGHGFGLTIALQCTNAGQRATALICVGTKTQLAANETTERDLTLGWVKQLNANQRAAGGGEVIRTYADNAAFRAETDSIDDSTLIRILSPTREFRYSTTSGADWVDDDNTILKQDSVSLGSNGRAFSTAQGAVCPTFDALRGLVGGKQDHVHLQSHTAFGDGGGGIFDRIAIYDGAEDDNGTIAIAGDWVYVRRDRESEKVNARWFGINGVDDTEAFTRALAYSVGATYADWVAGGGDSTMAIEHPSRVVVYSGTVALTSTIECRYRGLNIVGPTSYGEGYVSSTDRIVVAHNGVGIRLWTGPNTAEQYCPSLSLRGVILDRGEDFRSAPNLGIEVDGANWFRGLSIDRCYVVRHKSGAGFGSLYPTTGLPASGLTIIRSACAVNHEYGIDFGTVVMWDLSEIRDNGFNHNALGPCRIGIAAGSIERVDIEGGGGGGVIRAKCARVGHLYGEQTGDWTLPAIEVQAVDSTIQPSMSNDLFRACFFRLTDSLRSRVLDALPVKTENCSNCDLPSGWYSAPVDSISTISHICELAPYLERASGIPGATSSQLYADQAMYDTTRIFYGEALPAAEVGVFGSSANNVVITMPVSVVEGRQYLLALAVHHSTTPTDTESIIEVNGVGNCLLRGAHKTPARGTQQFVLIFTASGALDELSVTVRPYSSNSGNMGYGAAVSPVILVDITGLTGAVVHQLSVPRLLAAALTSRDGVSLKTEFYAESTTPITLTSNAAMVVATCKLYGLSPVSRYHGTIVSRVILELDSDPTVCGSVDLCADVYVATDGYGNATITTVGGQYPDISRLPSGLAGATVALSAATRGYSVAVVRPSGVQCKAQCRTWLEGLSEVGL